MVKLLVAVIAIVASLSALAGVNPASAAGPLTFGSPVLADHQAPFAFNGTIEGVSCPSASLCVAVDASGNVLTSTNPTGGGTAWTVANVDPGAALTAISCPTVSLCAAVDNLGNVVTSTNPTGGPLAWSVASVDAANAGPFGDLVAISCPGTFCVATDVAGNVVATIDAPGGAAEWKVIHVDASSGINAISCAGLTCVGADGAGNVVTTTDPFDASAWTTTLIDDSTPLDSVSCPSASFCIAHSAEARAVYTSTNPTGGAATWVPSTNFDEHAGGFTADGVTCTSASFCIAVDTVGNVVTFAVSPTGGITGSQVLNVDGTNWLGSISCPTPSFCVAGEHGSSVVTSLNPTAGASAWTVANIDSFTPIAGLSCPSASLCVGVDSAGMVLTTTSPTGGASAWKLAKVDNAALTAISCPTVSLCVAVDAAGNVVTSINPTGGASAWTAAVADDSPLVSISCLTSTLCVAGDNFGQVTASTNPTGGASAWKITLVDAGNGTLDRPNMFVSCFVNFFDVCLAADSHGFISTTISPAAGGWSAPTQIDLFPLRNVSCTSGPLCVIGDSAGAILGSTNPTGGISAWNFVGTDNDNPINGVSCPSASFCMAVDDVGNAIDSSTPTGGVNTWVPTDIDTTRYLTSLSCASASFCLAGDNTGRVVAATLGTGAPVVTSVLPTSGPTAGGTTVTVNGSGFTGATKVFFGTVAATSFTVVSSDQITAVAPAQAAAQHNIFVTTPSGTSEAVTDDTFTYLAGPAVTSISPTSGPAAGGTTVTVNGSNFTGATKVLFGTVPATSFSVVSSTKITAVAPAQAAAQHNVFVTTPNGTSVAVAGDEFTYRINVPAVTSVSPTSGPDAGGTIVTINGTSLTGATKVLFGTVPASSFSVVSSTKITAVAPAQAPAQHNIFVTTPGGTSVTVAGDEFTYLVGVPRVTSISPTSGPTAGGTTVTINGTDFNGATKVLFGTVAAVGFSVVSSTKITAVAPAQAATQHNVFVTTPVGTSVAVAADEFTYVAGIPAVTSISPTSGPAAGGTTVTVNGTNFTGATKVLFGTVPATSFTVVSATKITAVAPAQAAALHNIFVTTSGGTSATVAGDAFTYLPVPAVTSISPTSGPAAGGTTVTINGTGFTGATKVLFGTVPATSFTVVSATKITAVAPAQAAMLHNIFVTTPGGTSATVAGDAFTYH